MTVSVCSCLSTSTTMCSLIRRGNERNKRMFVRKKKCAVLNLCRKAAARVTVHPERADCAGPNGSSSLALLRFLLSSSVIGSCSSPVLVSKQPFYDTSAVPHHGWPRMIEFRSVCPPSHSHLVPYHFVPCRRCSVRVQVEGSLQPKHHRACWHHLLVGVGRHPVALHQA